MILCVILVIKTYLINRDIYIHAPYHLEQAKDFFKFPRKSTILQIDAWNSLNGVRIYIWRELKRIDFTRIVVVMVDRLRLVIFDFYTRLFIDFCKFIHDWSQCLFQWKSEFSRRGERQCWRTGRKFVVNYSLVLLSRAANFSPTWSMCNVKNIEKRVFILKSTNLIILIILPSVDFCLC